jgi:cytoskeletal protein CcmA (bactofilin family)
MDVGYFSPSKTDRESKSMTIDRSVPGSKQDLASASALLPPAPSEETSTLSHGMLITGNITCTGTVQIFGCVLGDIHATRLVVFEGAHVEGKVVAPEAVINGTFRGTIRGNNVELQSKAVVDGEIFNRSLAIAKDAQFEGVARRLEKPVEPPSSTQVKGESASAAMTDVLLLTEPAR